MHYMFDMNFKAEKIVLTTLMSSFLIHQKTVNHISEIPWHKGNQLFELYWYNKVGRSCILWEIGVLYQTITIRVFSLDVEL